MTAKDPVCGMEIEESEAAGRAQHEGRTYYFCSETCLKAFERMPQRFVEKK
jgi:P-type Cu+ transporter